MEKLAYKGEKMNLEIQQKKEKGITLIVLVITIIVLLILAGVTIATLTGDNGILTKANEAKESTEIETEKEIIELSILQVKKEDMTIEESELQNALNENCNENNKAYIVDSDIDNITLRFESSRYYTVDKSGNIKYVENITGEKILTVQCVNSRNEILREDKYTILTDNYSKFSPKINGYEAKNEIIQGDIEGDTTIKILYYYVIQEDDLIYTGVDLNGNVTDDNSKIIGYMIGDGKSKGYKEINKECILKIPKSHNKKNIIKISRLAFQSFSNLILADIGERSNIY